MSNVWLNKFLLPSLYIVTEEENDSRPGCSCDGDNDKPSSVKLTVSNLALEDECLRID
ncbi:hypothetical protein SERLA73DRAFT_185448 [Serpula lacrymans var. lacrymans S7.3]|uniref:Uncharacterized protein n=2 Tax=Serpula lacrymans var. lacrymans TaxID=341189 RepID=F8Q5U4_SERL3|nr:uncharacterized protein SERLADRAFT_473943 [Serpula lacrymans var. lacrymans S7.9]EGN95982.1 hypothetical protein SERLA73DRAFT_185448 [Serpula lacrymans var. lacrymans S7.3]EGO21507.1 hypothetical protein SERLADRAFT_473943 [Serpula lacrymans var. lacrymans S7.9]